MTAKTEQTRQHGRVTAGGWIRWACTLSVAGLAADASYQHQREYARGRQFGSGWCGIGAAVGARSVTRLRRGRPSTRREGRPPKASRGGVLATCEA